MDFIKSALKWGTVGTFGVGGGLLAAGGLAATAIPLVGPLVGIPAMLLGAPAVAGAGILAVGPSKVFGGIGNIISNAFGVVKDDAKTKLTETLNQKFNKATGQINGHKVTNTKDLGTSIGQALSKALNITPKQAEIVEAQVAEDPILAELIEDGELSADEIEIISAEIDDGELTLAPLDKPPTQTSAVSAINQHIIDGNAAKQSFSQNAGKLTPEERFTDADLQTPKARDSIYEPSLN